MSLVRAHTLKKSLDVRASYLFTWKHTTYLLLQPVLANGSQIPDIRLQPYWSPCTSFLFPGGGHGGRVATLSPPTSEIGVRFPAQPQVGKLVVAYRWSAVYSTEPWPTVCTGFLCLPNYPSWYDRYSVEKWRKTQINLFPGLHQSADGVRNSNTGEDDHLLQGGPRSVDSNRYNGGPCRNGRCSFVFRKRFGGLTNILCTQFRESREWVFFFQIYCCNWSVLEILFMPEEKLGFLLWYTLIFQKSVVMCNICSGMGYYISDSFIL